MRKKRDGLSRFEKILYTVIGVLVVLVGSATIWWEGLNAQPVVSIPAPFSPSVNAYNFYAQAGRGLEKLTWHSSSRGGMKPDAAGLAKMQDDVQRNLLALGVLRKGFAFPCVSPAVRSQSTPMGDIAKFTELSRLLVEEGRVKEAKGDLSGAASCYLDAVRLGQDIPNGTVSLVRMTGLGCQQIGRRALWSSLGQLDAAGARAATRRMEDIITREVPYAQTVEQEKYMGQSEMMEMFNHPNWRTEDLKEWKEADQQTLRDELRYLTVNKRKVMLSYTAYMDACIADAKKPFDRKRLSPPKPRDPVNLFMAVDQTREARLSSTLNSALNALLATDLALHAYKVDHGVYPTTLSALEPMYLKRIPEDPFGLGAALRYHGGGSTFVLYSVGPDGHDDGGRAIGGGAASGGHARIRISDGGDIVAGVNAE